MIGMTDIHCHILPGVDDGAGSMEETVASLRRAADQGISRIFVTPHHHPGRYMAPVTKILETLEQVREECVREAIPVTLYPGQECQYYSDLTNDLVKEQALTLGRSRYVLVEFEPDSLYSLIFNGLNELRCGGYQPIVAHFERYTCLYDRRNLEELRERGYLLQMNQDTLLKKNSLLRRYPWRQMIQDGLVDYIGSDCHGMHYRPYRMDQVSDWMKEQVSPKIQKRMMKDQIRNILCNV